MAKKTKAFSHVEAQDSLEKLSGLNLSGQTLIYELLRIFCGYGDGQIRRVKEGPGNKAKDERTVVVKDVLAYRSKGLLDFYDEIKLMQEDAHIQKQKPRLYVVSDGEYIVAFDPKEQDIYENEVALMWKDFEFFYPLAGIEKFCNYEEAEADVKSAELMAKLFDEIRRHNNVKDEMEMHNLNIFISRLLFCFFAEDTNLFPEARLFTNSISKFTSEDGHDLAEFIDRAFLAMSTDNQGVRDNLPKQYTVFPYVNGGLFEKRLPIPVLSRRARILMIKCGDYNWADINPDIFGSMIQAVVSPEMRAGLGMHYTSVPNIMKLIRPLFLDSLHEEFQEAKDRRDVKRLRALLVRLGKIKFFDPACGSGNFLIVAYKRVRELEILIWQALIDLGASELPLSNIHLQQFYGIELDEFACDTATLSLWLAEHQMNIKFNDALGYRPDALPLRPSGHIVCGNACRVDWNKVCPHTLDEEIYIMSNPPYVGSSLQNESQKADMNTVFYDVKGWKNLDYISCWFYLAAKYIGSTSAKCAFVTTNSICQGEQVSLLWNPIFNLSIEIFFAYQNFKWSNNAKNNAGVTCMIIGMRTEDDKESRYIYANNVRHKVGKISPYIIPLETSVIVEKLTKPLCPVLPMDYGSKAADDGQLLLNDYERNMLPVGANRYVKNFVGSEELINDVNRYCLWIEEKEVKDAMMINEISRRVENVRQARLKSKKEATRKDATRPYQFAEIRYNDSESIIIPSVSSERRQYIPIGYLAPGTVVSNSAFAIYGAQMWLFAILTSRMHMVWVKIVGGRLETRYRYSTQLCYNTFPFPLLREVQKEELTELAQNVLDIRDQHFDMTLGEMYNPETMPEDLKDAHHRLDLAVERCYRLTPFTSDEERLEHLFKLYIKMTKK